MNKQLMFICVWWLFGQVAVGYLYMDDEGDSDDLISGHGSGCAKEDTECLPHPTDALISPSITITHKSTTTTSTTTTTTVSPADPSPVPDFSGSDCENDDDEDCGSGRKMATDDIEFVITEEETTPTSALVVTANITERTTKAITTKFTPWPTKPPQQKTKTPNAPVLPGVGVTASPGTGPNKEDPEKGFVFNIGLIIGIAASVVLLLLILAYALYKYKSRDEGTYKVDEGKNYRYETVSTKAPPQQMNGNSLPRPSHNNQPKAKAKKGSVKEWYV